MSGFGSSFSYLIRVWSVLWSSLVEVFIGFAWQEPETGGSRSQSVGAGLNDLSWSRNLHLESKNLNDEPAENNPEIFTPGGLPLLLPHYDTSKRHAIWGNQQNDQNSALVTCFLIEKKGSLFFAAITWSWPSGHPMCSRWHYFASFEWPHIAALSASSHPINHCQVNVTIIMSSLLLISCATLEVLTAQPITSKIDPQSFPWTQVCFFSQFAFDQACLWFRAKPQQSLMTLSSIQKLNTSQMHCKLYPFYPSNECKCTLMICFQCLSCYQKQMFSETYWSHSNSWAVTNINKYKHSQEK